MSTERHLNFTDSSSGLHCNSNFGLKKIHMTPFLRHHGNIFIYVRYPVFRYCDIIIELQLKKFGPIRHRKRTIAG